mgnify:CR=1 FL=1|jgi:hypothetical protein
MMKVALCVDRFEGPLAVLVHEDGHAVNWPREFLPKACRAGDLLSFHIEKDERATRRMAEETRKVQEDLERTDPGGDLTI